MTDQSTRKSKSPSAWSRPYRHREMTLRLRKRAVSRLTGPIDTDHLQIALDAYGVKISGHNRKGRRVEKYLQPNDFQLIDAIARPVTLPIPRVFRHLQTYYGRDIVQFVFK